MEKLIDNATLKPQVTKAKHCRWDLAVGQSRVDVATSIWSSSRVKLIRLAKELSIEVGVGRDIETLEAQP